MGLQFGLAGHVPGNTGGWIGHGLVGPAGHSSLPALWFIRPWLHAHLLRSGCGVAISWKVHGRSVPGRKQIGLSQKVRLSVS